MLHIFCFYLSVPFQMFQSNELSYTITGICSLWALSHSKLGNHLIINFNILPWLNSSIHLPLFPRRPAREWPSLGRCIGGSWVLHRGHPCRKPGRRCRGPAERGNPPRRPGGRQKTNRGWKRMRWGWALTTATPKLVPLQPAPYKNNEK